MRSALKKSARHENGGGARRQVNDRRSFGRYSQYVSRARRTALFSFVAALGLVLVKLAIGLATGSLGIIAEAVHSAIDAGSALLTLWAVGIAEQPPDREHLYGHGKAQNLSALAEAVLLSAAAAWIAVAAIDRLTGSAAEIEPAAYAFVVLGGVLVVDAARALASFRVSRDEKSAALAANALHFGADFVSTLAVLAGLALTAAGYPKADAIAALFVAVLVVYAAVRLAARNVSSLMDRAPADGATLGALVASVPGVAEVRSLRVRESGGTAFADVVIGVDRLGGLERSHDVMDAVEKRLEEALGGKVQVTVHAEPIAAHERPTERVIAASLRVAGVVEVHNVTVLDLPGGRVITLHARLDAHLSLEDARAVIARLREEITRDEPATVHVHLEPHEPESLTAVVDHDPVRRERVGRAVSSVCSDELELSLYRLGGRLVAVIEIRTAPSLSIDQAHALAGSIEEAVREAVPELHEVIVDVEAA